ncbi:hypothetical protein N9R79_12230, partial [Vibrio sp.]|nr:hypothetical protein [Vibrio sp.]
MGAVTKGRPITLVGDSSCWLTQGDLNQLQALAETGQPFTMVRGEVTEQVMFRYAQPPVIDAKSLWLREDTEEEGSDVIRFELNTVKLITV